MAVARTDAKQMQKLAHEGKQISRIWRDDFPKYEYWDVYWAIRGEGGQSSRGIKSMITARLAKLVDADKATRKDLVAELSDLVTHLYQKHKDAQKKLDGIRKSLEPK